MNRLLSIISTVPPPTLSPTLLSLLLLCCNIIINQSIETVVSFIQKNYANFDANCTHNSLPIFDFYCQIILQSINQSIILSPRFYRLKNCNCTHETSDIFCTSMVNPWKTVIQYVSQPKLVIFIFLILSTNGL